MELKPSPRQYGADEVVPPEDEHEGVYEIQYCVACNTLENNRAAAQKAAEELKITIRGDGGDSVCAVCGSDDVEHAMWVTLKTDKVGEVFGTWCNGDNNWCPKCDEHTELIERHEFQGRRANAG